MEKHWSNLQTMFLQGIEVGASGSGAANLTCVRRTALSAPFTKGAQAVVSLLDLGADSDVGISKYF